MVITIGKLYLLFCWSILHVLDPKIRNCREFIFLCQFFAMISILEPGLYIPRDAAYPEKYQGIGIRIEDNVVIGKTVPHVLSVTAPKEIVDIEYCCASSAKSD